MNILIFTNYYPVEGANGAMPKIVNYFAESLVALDHNVVVVNSSSSFPIYYYFLPKWIEKGLESYLGYSVPNRHGKKLFYDKYNGVNFIQLPVKKLIPGSIITDRNFKNNFNELLDYFTSINFFPDLAVGHWHVPQVNYLEKIKELYKCKTSLIFHYQPKKKEIDIISKKLKFIDNVGFRNETLMKRISELFHFHGKKRFLNYSGVTDFLSMKDKPFVTKLINKRNIKICFVGQLIKRKHPDKIIEAVCSIPDINFELHFIGEGSLRKSLYVNSSCSNVRVFLHGRIPREETYKIVQECDFQIMISEEEAFGLVYLEAMLCRTIPIASYDEGFDGIIKDSYNGFLCKSGDASSLRLKLLDILNMNNNELNDIQKNAFETACQMTDEKMALKYLLDVG